MRALAILALEAVLFAAVFAVISDLLLKVFGKKFRSPYVPTSRKHFATIFDALDLASNSVFYDLGCGGGSFLLYCAKRAPEAACVGVEYHPFFFALARLRTHLPGAPKNVRIVWGDLFKQDLRDATHLYAYLVPAAMQILSAKLERDGMHGRVVSRAFSLSGMHEKRIIRLPDALERSGDTLFVYDI